MYDRKMHVWVMNFVLHIWQAQEPHVRQHKLVWQQKMKPETKMKLGRNLRNGKAKTKVTRSYVQGRKRKGKGPNTKQPNINTESAAANINSKDKDHPRDQEAQKAISGHTRAHLAVWGACVL